MQEELNQIKINNIWTLVERPEENSIIEIKWVYRNKLDENRIVIRNKARLVTQEYNQEKDINYDEIFIPIDRLVAIRLLLTFAYFMGFKLYQIDVKSIFLNGIIKEEV